jgi:hypothetical protein
MIADSRPLPIPNYVPSYSPHNFEEYFILYQSEEYGAYWSYRFPQLWFYKF